MILKNGYILLSVFFITSSLSVSAFSAKYPKNDYDQWLKKEFSAQHESLIPIVAVASILSGCNEIRQIEQITYQLKNLIVETDKAVLAEKLITCLGDDEIKSEQAIDFGIIGCFGVQFETLELAEKVAKTNQVKALLTSLSYQEKQQSFTKCTTMQAIEYLQ